MKRTLITAALFLLTISFSGSAFAKSKSTDVEIYQASQVAGTTLQPGSYKVAVNTTGSTAQVTFSKNGKQVASVNGQVVQLARKSNTTSVTIDNSSTVPTIAQIDVEGSQTAISFSSQAASANAGE